MKKFYNQENWINETKKQIKKFSDREIIVHNKFSNVHRGTIKKRLGFC